MKTYLPLVAASFVLGLLVFVICYFIFHLSTFNSVNYAICAALGGLAGELIRNYNTKRGKKAGS